jgi:DNA (cytosine-5)-methyltransferase 1
MKHGSLFSGIGGFDLAAHWMGWENAFHCEWMEFPRKVLDYYFPEADSHVDICKTDFRKYEGKVDIITGGFPCQPFSMAGKRKGTDDERYLWDEMLRTIQEVKPKYVIAENVFGLTNIEGGLVFEKVWSDLEAQGYEVQPFVIPSAGKNAPHRRDRIWIIAYRSGLRFDTRRSEQSLSRNRTNGNEGDATDTTNFRRKNALAKRKLERRRSRVGNKPPTWNAFPSQSPICGGNDGLPTELDGITFSKWRNQSIKGYGNAIVPQVALEIFKVIQEIDNQLL